MVLFAVRSFPNRTSDLGGEADGSGASRQKGAGGVPDCVSDTVGYSKGARRTEVKLNP